MPWYFLSIIFHVLIIIFIFIFIFVFTFIFQFLFCLCSYFYLYLFFIWCFQVKAMDLNESCEELLNRCPDPPIVKNVRTAQSILTQMRALDAVTGKISPLGEHYLFLWLHYLFCVSTTFFCKQYLFLCHYFINIIFGNRAFLCRYRLISFFVLILNLISFKGKM